MAKSKKTTVDRRSFLKTAAGAAGLVAIPPVIQARPEEPKPRGATPIMPKDAEVREPAPSKCSRPSGSGSDFMVDVIKSLGLRICIARIPDRASAALHESLINYGGNKSPEFITCCHEESSVAMAHGYAKIEGKPMRVMAHGTVGLQHASMAIYNAFCDRVPIYHDSRQHRSMRPCGARSRMGAQRAGRGGDGARLTSSGTTCRFAAALRRIGRARLQDRDDAADDAGGAGGRQRTAGRPHRDGRRSCAFRSSTLASPPQGDSGAVAEAARLLVAAENPVIVADRAARTPQG